MRMLIRNLFGLLAGVVLLSGHAQGACLGEPNTTKVYTFDVVPQLTATKIYTTWSPLLQRVGQDAGLCFELRVSATIPEFEQKLLKGEPEFVSSTRTTRSWPTKKRNTNPCWLTAKIYSQVFWSCALTAQSKAWMS